MVSIMHMKLDNRPAQQILFFSIMKFMIIISKAYITIILHSDIESLTWTIFGFSQFFIEFFCLFTPIIEVVHYFVPHFRREICDSCSRIQESRIPFFTSCDKATTNGDTMNVKIVALTLISFNHFKPYRFLKK